MTQPEYARSQERMLEELWTRYGPWFYIRFDGGAASPEQGGPDLVPIFKEHQPHANVFQGPVATTRWVGNERGVAGYPCWATVPQLNDSGSGSPEGTVWQPGECDVPIRDHNWFWREGEDDKIHSLDALVDMYHRSVGHNCNLLLNANPDLRGLIPDADMRRYRELGRAIHRLYGKPEARTSGVGELQVLELPQPMAIDRLSIMEDIRYGERIREFEVELRTGGDTWRTVATGSAVGHKRLLTFDPVTTPLVRLRVLRADGIPVLRDFAAYAVS